LDPLAVQGAASERQCRQQKALYRAILTKGDQVIEFSTLKDFDECVYEAVFYAGALAKQVRRSS
jgi:hypothetical protein